MKKVFYATVCVNHAGKVIVIDNNSYVSTPKKQKTYNAQHIYTITYG